jgi:hypothetical protein
MGRGDLSVREMAAALGVAKSEVHRQKQKGMPMHSADAARVWRAEHLDAGRVKGARMSIDEKPLPQPAAPAASASADEAADPVDDSSDSAEYRQHRATRERLRAKREQLELDQLRGSLVDAAEVSRLRFTEFRGLRDALGNIGARIKDACAVEADPLRCQQLIDSEIDATLAAFADSVLTRGVTQDVDDDDPD